MHAKKNKKLINNIIRGKHQLNWCRDYQCPSPQKFIGKQNGTDLTVHLLNLMLKNTYKSLSCFSSTTLNLTLPCFRERNKRAIMECGGSATGGGDGFHSYRRQQPKPTSGIFISKIPLLPFTCTFYLYIYYVLVSICCMHIKISSSSSFLLSFCLFRFACIKKLQFPFSFQYLNIFVQSSTRT